MILKGTGAVALKEMFPLHKYGVLKITKATGLHLEFIGPDHSYVTLRWIPGWNPPRTLWSNY